MDLDKMAERAKWDSDYTPEEHLVDWPADVARLVRVAHEQLGVDLTAYQAAALWSGYSESGWCAGWLRLYADDEQLADSLAHIFEIYSKED